MFMFICGTHASGKTSLLRALEENKVAEKCGYEIGKELFYREKFIPDQRDEEFEIKITKLELERDAKFSSIADSCICAAETWHPGNLAYVAVRNPESFPKLLALMKTSPLLPHAWGIKLTATREQVYERTKTFKSHDDKDAVLDFLYKVGEKIDYCIEALGLKERVITVNTDKDLDSVFEYVKKIIQKNAYSYRRP